MSKPAPEPPSEIPADDAALFRTAIGKVTRLAKPDRITPQPARRKPILRSQETAPAVADTLSDFSTEPAPEEFLRNGVARITLRKLRRISWPIQDRLDLHGNTGDAARKLLQQFLHDAVQQKMRCVLIIHGKGLNSGGEGVLRQLARCWLMQHAGVLGYCEAPVSLGGSGAVLVLLKQV